MSISTQDIKTLWGRSGNRCAICRIELTFGTQAYSTYLPLGEHAHIVAKEPNGPRGQNQLSAEQRDDYRNLILLCPTHHALIDKAVGDYPVERLQQIKQEHESWVKRALSGKINDDSSVKRLDRAESSLVLHDYAGSFQELRQASQEEKGTSLYHFLCAVTILAGRSVNIISPVERNQITNHLLRARSLDCNWRPTLLLMLLIDTDYYDLHGLENNFYVSAKDLMDEVRSARPAPGQERIITQLPMSDRFRSTLFSVKENET